MKTIQPIRTLAAFFTVALMALVLTAQNAWAQQPTHTENQIESVLLRNGQYQFKSTPEELARFRSQLAEMNKNYREMLDMYMPSKAEELSAAAAKLEQLTPLQLDLALREMDKNLIVKANEKLRAAVEQGRAAGQANRPGFPNADYPDCAKTPDGVLIAADVALLVQEAVYMAASRVCEQVVVGVAGGNTSLACIPVDAAWIVVKGINYALHVCNDLWDGAESSATYERLGHMHEDIEASVSNDNANKNAIIDNSNSNKTAITTAIDSSTTNIKNSVTGAKDAVINNSNAGKDEIINNSNANKTTIVNNDNANKIAIVSNDNANKDAIVTNDNNNRTMVINNDNANKDFILRLQIEANLAAPPDTTSAVGLFVLPAARGGYLELTRSILAQHIASLGSLSYSDRARAESLMATGDASRNMSDFLGAYTFYRRAYKAASGVGLPVK